MKKLIGNGCSVMEKEKSKKKLFLPMIISVVITILLHLFSKLFVQDFREIVNYIFIGFIYLYLYLSLYFLFNMFYIGALKKYFKILNKLHLINISGDIAKVENKKMLIYLYMFITFCVVSFILLIWQLILGVKFINITNIICLVIFLVLFILSIIMLKNIFKKKSKKNWLNKEKYAIFVDKCIFF